MAAEAATRRRFLLIGIDGVRFDRLTTTETPHLDRVIDAGFLHTARIPSQNPTMSGAQWATILTGVWSTEHGVRRNWMPSRRLARHPELLQQLQAREPGAEVFAAVSWPPLGRRRGCGPVLRTPTYVPVARPTTLRSWQRADELVLDHALEQLARPELSAGFVYLGQVDIAGHLIGTGTAYVEALERVDGMIGRLLDALEARGDREEWAVMITTDHGHRDAGGHGTRTLDEETVWFACDTALPGWESLDSAGVPAYLLRAVGASR